MLHPALDAALVPVSRGCLRPAPQWLPVFSRQAFAVGQVWPKEPEAMGPQLVGDLPGGLPT